MAAIKFLADKCFCGLGQMERRSSCSATIGSLCGHNTALFTVNCECNITMKCKVTHNIKTHVLHSNSNNLDCSASLDLPNVLYHSTIAQSSRWKQERRSPPPECTWLSFASQLSLARATMCKLCATVSGKSTLYSQS